MRGCLELGLKQPASRIPTASFIPVKVEEQNSARYDQISTSTNQNLVQTKLESHPKARSFRNKKVPCFENLVLLFGADRATGHDAETAMEKRLRLEREKNEAELVFLGDKKVEESKGVSSGPVNNEMELSIESSEVPSSSRGSKKRKGGASGGSSLHEEFKMLKGSLDTIASAYGQSSPRVILEDELFMEVKKIEGLNEDAVLIAYDFICGDPVRGRTFVGLPVNWRKRWLEIKLGCDFGKV